MTTEFALPRTYDWLQLNINIPVFSEHWTENWINIIKEVTAFVAAYDDPCDDWSETRPELDYEYVNAYKAARCDPCDPMEL